ncbi:DUF6265 family protein [Simiduia curdlanivorans]|uniref:DUF6265 family protein n=1 Tax=Simiduia curdlanivorans TaxID=1492769 RepID=A0ABV8V4Q9_9GAMM|nr:DUF6265 family protein [Simiduia curdlanivorans]MDN3641043.1 DUF6265 family protein [Simiduia curdlanivorans]
MTSPGHALRGLQQFSCALLQLLDRPRYAFEAAPRSQKLLQAREVPELFRGALGSWVAHSGKQITTEAWASASSHTFEGKGMSFSDNQLKSVESLRIVEMSGALYFIAKVSHNALPVVLSLTSCTATSARFENVARDFPKRIQYSLAGADQLSATVSDAVNQGISINFTRQTAKGN